MAEVGAVYDITPAPRTPADIFPARDTNDTEPATPHPAPVARNKWLVASVVHNAASVVGQIFDEADRRDPRRRRTWVALVDGNNHQIDRINAEAVRADLPDLIRAATSYRVMAVLGRGRSAPGGAAHG
jgi:hypothetical protein